MKTKRPCERLLYFPAGQFITDKNLKIQHKSEDQKKPNFEPQDESRKNLATFLQWSNIK